MNNLKIREKFLLIGIIISLAILILVGLSIKINTQSNKNLNSVVKSFKMTQDIQTLYIENLFTLRETTLSLVVSPNNDYKKQADKKLMPIIKNLDTNFKNRKENIVKIWKNYKNIVLKTREYTLNGFDEGAFMNTSSVEREVFYQLISALKEIQKKEIKISETKLENSKKSTISNNYYLLITVLFIILIMYFLDVFIIKNITRRIEKVQNALVNFFEYLLNPTIYKKQLYIKNIKDNDEIGLMKKAINQGVKTVKENLEDNYKIITEATLTVESLRRGEFGKRLQLKSKSKELNTLKNVINDMINDLENKIQEEIGQRTSQEKLLIQQSKLAAMGEMIGNIAHQWRQPISEINAVLMEIETISRYSILEKEYLLESIKTCNKITEHMSTTISDFQNFFKPTKKKEEFSVLKACKKALSIINASLKNNNIELIFDIKEDNTIEGYSSEFSHAILNIISNAKDILVQRNIKNPKIILSIKVGKKYTIIKIEDNAGGIKLEDINIIFEPYFTTKHAKQGTGIGLYMTKMIIENNMQGFVKVENTKDGALFTIKI